MTARIDNLPRAQGQELMRRYAESILARIGGTEVELGTVLREVAHEHNTVISEVKWGLAWLGDKVTVTHRSPVIRLAAPQPRDRAAGVEE